MSTVPSGLVKASSAITSYRSQSPGAEGVGFRTNQFRCDNTQSSGLADCATDFLLGSRIGRGDMEFNLSVGDYFADPMIVTYGKLDHEQFVGEPLAMPKSSRLRVPLDQVISQRRSGRDYTGEPLDFRDVAAILRGAAGVTGHMDVTRSDGESERYNLRAVSSGGGLYPVSVYLSARSVSGLAVGIYRYAPIIDKLVPAGGADACQALRRTLAGEPAEEQSRSAGAHIVFTITPWRSMRKYGPRGLRFALQEVGAIAQQMSLICAALGLAAVESSSFYEDELNRVLGVDGVYETATHTMTVGIPA